PGIDVHLSAESLIADYKSRIVPRPRTTSQLAEKLGSLKGLDFTACQKRILYQGTTLVVPQNAQIKVGFSPCG
ncbi:MAG: hypothetical protein WBE63_14315, partial [Acidobacteriaceae bacterium]